MVPLACQSICPALLFISMLFCPESPRWLASQDRWDKATAVLSDVRRLPADHAYVQQELLELRTQIEQERAVMRGSGGFWGLQRECWTVPTNRKRALLVVAIISFQQWSGVSLPDPGILSRDSLHGVAPLACTVLTIQTGAINYYAPTIFKGLGLSSTTTALFAQGIYGVVKVVACLFFMFFLADTLGRRMTFMCSGVLQAFCMLFIGFVSILRRGRGLVLGWTLTTDTSCISMSGSALRPLRVRVHLPPVLRRSR
jgi:hypothetical protein